MFFHHQALISIGLLWVYHEQLHRSSERKLRLVAHVAFLVSVHRSSLYSLFCRCFAAEKTLKLEQFGISPLSPFFQGVRADMYICWATP